MNHATNATALRQVTLGLRLGAINHDEALSILEALIDSFELHQAANRCREQRSREEFLRSLNPITNVGDAYAAGREAAADIMAAKQERETAHVELVAKHLDPVAELV